MKLSPPMLQAAAVVQNLIILRRWRLDQRAENLVDNMVSRVNRRRPAPNRAVADFGG